MISCYLLGSVINLDYLNFRSRKAHSDYDHEWQCFTGPAALGRLLLEDSLREDCLLISSGCRRPDVCSQAADLQTQSPRPCFKRIVPQLSIHQCGVVPYLYDRQANETESGAESDKRTE